MANNDFSERYKKYSVLQLVEIIENRKKYQHTAVNAAIAELESRGTSSTEITSAKGELHAKKLNETAALRKREEIQRQIRTKGVEVINKVVASPLTREQASFNKTILSIGIVFIIEFIYTIGTWGSLLNFMFTDPYAKWDMSAIFMFEGFWLLPIAIILFMWRKRAGWILLATHIQYSILIAISSWTYLQISFAHNGWNLPSGTILLSLAFVICTLYFIYTKKMRGAFGIANNHVTISILVTLALVISAYYSLINPD